MTMRTLILLFLTCLASVAQSDPTHQTPTASLDLHGLCQHNVQLASACQTLDQMLVTRKEPYAAGSRNPDQLPYGELGAVYQKSLQIQRFANLLVAGAEPSGIDFRYRANNHVNMAGSALNAARTTDRGRKETENARKALESKRPGIEKLGAELETLVEDKEWSAAETAYVAFYESLTPLLGWIPPKERSKYLAPLSISGKIEKQMQFLRTRATQEQLIAAINTAGPDVGTFSNLIEQTIADVGNTGSVTIDGLDRTGPEAIVQLVGRWHQINTGCVRCRSIQLAVIATGKRYNAPSGYGDGRGEIEDPGGEWMVAVEQTRDYLIDSLPKIIIADADRIEPTDAIDLYNQYAKAIAEASVLIAPQYRHAIFESGLDALLQKAGDEAEAFIGERTATKELLRWRRRVSQTDAIRRTSDYPTLPNALRSYCQHREGYVGLVPPTKDAQKPPQLFASVPETMPETAARMIGKTVTTSDAFPVSGASGVFLSHYDDQTVSQIAAVVDLRPHAEALRWDLRLSAQQTPSSWQALAAIDTIGGQADSLGPYFRAVGGQVTGVRLQSVIVGLSQDPSVGFRLYCGQLPIRGPQNEFVLGQVTMNCQLNAAWVQHEYFVADLTTQTADTLAQ